MELDNIKSNSEIYKRFLEKHCEEKYMKEKKKEKKEKMVHQPVFEKK